MSRDFVGTGYGEPVRYTVHMEEGGHQHSFTQQVRGVARTFQWDGAGPDSDDLSRALLWVTTGVEPAWRMYHLFKSEVVSAWPRKHGECWHISHDEISRWLDGVERDTAATENSSQTKTRLEQTALRESRVRGFAGMFKAKR